MIADIRQIRLAIANKRARDMANRYPEISVSAVTPLTDEAIVAAALARELDHHRKVLSDIEAASAKRD